MANRPTKLMLIGLDAPVPKAVWEHAKKGKLPTFAKLIREGVFAENCLAPFPTITPPNWTTIVTGAWAGTHGITCFNVHKPGTPLDATYQGLYSADCQAEYIWNVAEKADRRCIIFNYPSTWPTTLKKGIQIAGAGLSVNEWRMANRGHHPPKNPKPGSQVAGMAQYSVCDAQLFTIEPYPRGISIQLNKASGWKNTPPSSGDDLEAELPFVYAGAVDEVKDKKAYHLLVQKGAKKGYDRVIVAPTKDCKKAVATLKVGEWSETLSERFNTSSGRHEGIFRVKLIELSKDAKKLRLFFTPMCQTDGWSFPKSLAKELRGINGLPLPDSLYRHYMLGWIDADTCMELWEMVHTWYAEAITKLMQKREWDMFFMHAHIMDWAGHSILTPADPARTQDKKKVALHQKMLLESYQSCDRLLKRILANADDDTLIVIVSDHGAKAHGPHVPVAKILEDAGLLVHKPKKADTMRPRPIDWKRTKAVQQRAAYIYVNLKGRDPQGIVKPGAEYEEVRDKVIAALYDYVDPETGKRPITLALRREDARILGLYGDKVGDVVYAVGEEFGAQHGQLLTTEEFGIGSLKPLFMMRGPNVKKNFVLERNMWLTDIVPTICHLMNLPIPKQCEGAVVYQALQDPNIGLAELQEMQMNYDRLSKTYEAEVSLTHSYNR